jgi:uncharacterized protein YbbC (DUF1343 family)
VSGLDRLLKQPVSPYPGSRIGLLCHHASVTRDGTHITDLISKQLKWRLSCIFSPEHGFSGTAAPGEHVRHSIHEPTGVPIHSLYGETRIPDPDWLQDLELVVTDLMDLGVRCYTYASTLMEMMLACAKAGIPMLVLDRQTPLHGVLDGPDLDPECVSFVGRIPLPLVYGKSQGELALFLQETLPELKSLKVEVWKPDGATFSKWIPPSPAIVSAHAALCYPVTVWSEAVPEVWVDRGGTDSFQVWGMPDFPAGFELPAPSSYGFDVTADSFHTPHGRWNGLRLKRNPEYPCRPVCLAHDILRQLIRHLRADRLFNAEGARPDFFDQLAGTRDWRKHLFSGRDPDFFTRNTAGC